MQTVTVTFEASGQSKQYDAKKVERLHDYHGAQIGTYTDRKRTAFKVPAPTGELDFDYKISKVA